MRQLSGDVTVLGAATSTAACSEIYAAFVPKGDSWRKEALKHSEIDLDVRCKTDDDFESGTAPLELHVRCPPATTPVEESMREDGTAVHPFHSLHAARDAIRELPESLRAAGVRVTIHPGQYPPLELGADDSGRAGAPAVWQAARSDAPTVISGAADVPGHAFKPWAERPGVWKVDLRTLGITRYGNLSTNDSGAGNLGCAQCMYRARLFYRLETMTLARYPNAAADGTWRYSFIDHGGSGVFGVSPLENVSGRLSSWLKEKNPWLHGYWQLSWADGYVPLRGVQPLPSGVVNVSAGPFYENNALVKPGARFYGVNLLCELDTPSEYYIDDEEGALYFWPPEGSGPPAQWAAGTCGVSVNDTAINVSNASHIVLRGLTVTGAVHTGIEGSGVDSVHVDNCTVSGHGRHGISLDGRNSGVTNSHVHSVGGSGMRITGGEAMTLTPGKMFATSNHVHQVGLWKRTYQPALFWGGVQNRYIGNVLEDGPAMLIWGGGNVADGVECVFDRNTVSH